MGLGRGVKTPDGIFMEVSGLEPAQAFLCAQLAKENARRMAPKLTGQSAQGIQPIHGPGYFGLKWERDQVWYQNSGVRPFVMRSLAGKIIPMWIDDPNGEQATANPKAKTRVTASGRRQVLIFRKAAPMGTRKSVNRRIGGSIVEVSVPRAYPGAPGRIALREAAQPYTTAGKVGGRVAAGNVGIRWYFPGLSPRNFLQQALVEAAQVFSITPGPIKEGYDFYERPGEGE